ncbi:MAG: hypothetical protein ACYSTS_06930 [Planctomycetota bacterium]|jgi:hypothetical protein
MNEEDRLSKEILGTAFEVHRHFYASSILLFEPTKVFLCALGVFAVNNFFFDPFGLGLSRLDKSKDSSIINITLLKIYAMLFNMELRERYEVDTVLLIRYVFDIAFIFLQFLKLYEKEVPILNMGHYLKFMLP